jgi:hypothetical protein
LEAVIFYQIDIRKPPEIDWLIERSKIIEVIVAFANALDEKNWQKLRGYLATEIEINYLDFRGEPPRRVTGEE